MCFPFLISRQQVASWYSDFYTALYFVNQRKYKTLAMQAHVLARTRYFSSLNVIISHPIVKGRTGLSLSMCYRFAVFPSLPRVHLWWSSKLGVMLRPLCMRLFSFYPQASDVGETHCLVPTTVVRMVEVKTVQTFWLDNLKERDCLRDTGLDDRIILKCILRK
jgi:hypothetical protein